MCQLSSKMHDSTMLLTEPMTVWKLIEVDSVRTAKVTDKRSYYQQMSIKMNETYVKCQNNEFIERVTNKSASAYIPNSTKGFFELGDEGYHSFTDLADAVQVLGVSRRYRHRITSSWKPMIARCEIPAGSSYIKGAFYDIPHIKTVVSNAIKYVEILNPATIDTEANDINQLIKPS